MRCPLCKLDNPSEAMRCDCGFDFESGNVMESYLINTIEKPSASLLVVGWIFSILGGWIGIVIACLIAFGKGKNNKLQYRYDESSRKMGKVMLCISILMTVFGIIRLALK